jgi:excisionase family DNA binding protein
MDPGNRISYRVAEASQLTGISRRTLECHIRAGRLRSRLIGGVRVILRKDLLSFLSADRPFAAPNNKTRKSAPAAEDCQ